MSLRSNGLIRIVVALVVGGILVGLGQVGAGSAYAAAGITFEGFPGTSAPPSALGPYTMAGFPEDPQPIANADLHGPGGRVSGVDGPTGVLAFDPP